MGTVPEPESVTLYYRGTKDLLVFLVVSGSLLLLAVGIASGQFLVGIRGYVVIVLATLGAIAALANWVCAHFYYIRTGPEGLTTRFLSGKRMFQWNEIRNVMIAETKSKGLTTNRMVVFDVSPYSEAFSSWFRLTKALGGLPLCPPEPVS
jgi:hypothetical protein